MQAFSADGDFQRVVAADDHGDGALDLDDPRGVALAADGSILIAENEHEVIARIAPGGATTTWHAPGVVGVAVSPDGSVLAVDEHANIVRRTTVDGAPLGSLGAGSAPETQPGERLNRPAAVATDCRGAVYVADRAEQRIHVFGDAGLAAPPCVVPPPPPIPPTPPAVAAAPGPEPQSQVAGISEASPEPTLGASGVGEPVSGTVLVQKPGDRCLQSAPAPLQAAGRHDRRRHERRRAHRLRDRAGGRRDLRPDAGRRVLGRPVPLLPGCDGIARRRDPHGRPARLR